MVVQARAIEYHSIGWFASKIPKLAVSRVAHTMTMLAQYAIASSDLLGLPKTTRRMEAIDTRITRKKGPPKR
jgi:hypothetical protein